MSDQVVRDQNLTGLLVTYLSVPVAVDSVAIVEPVAIVDQVLTADPARPSRLAPLT